MRINNFLFTIILLLIAPVVPAQSIGTYLGDEEILNAQTKQVNQFFRRFNCEESTDGKRYYDGDPLFRDLNLRSQYLSILFDEKSRIITPEIKSTFIEDVLSKSNPDFLNFHGGDWFAEVSTIFLFKGEEKKLTLFLRLQEEEIGSKWVITNVFFLPFSELFFNNQPNELKFIHPLSHELDFMNLIHIFSDKENVEHYMAREYHPDFLTLFIYEMKKSDLKFKTITGVKFHFFQIPGWYFELSDFNRKSKNSGWLISNLLKISEDEKDLLMKYIYHE